MLNKDKLVFLYSRTKSKRIKRKLRTKIWGKTYSTTWDLIKKYS